MTSIHERLKWVYEWNTHPTIGYSTPVIPVITRQTFSKLFNEQEELMHRLYIRKKPNLLFVEDEKRLNDLNATLSKLGLLHVGTEDLVLIRKYHEQIEYTSSDQQFSVTHQVYLLDPEIVDQTIIKHNMDMAFRMYHEGHSSLHTIVSPYSLDIYDWVIRYLPIGFVYHHPDWMMACLETCLTDRPYTSLITNYKSPHNQPTLPLGELRFGSRVCFIHQEYPLEDMYTIDCIERDIPIIVWGDVPAYFMSLPKHLFNVQFHHLFPEKDFYYTTVTSIREPLPESVAAHLFSFLVPQLSALVSFRTIGTWKEGEVFPDLPLTQEEWETCITLTNEAVPPSWLNEFKSQPYKMFRVDYPVSLHMNAAISFVLNRWLFSFRNSL